MKCIFCGKEIDEGSIFCGYCGKQLPKVRYCIKCGQEIGLDDSFCGFCGAPQDASFATNKKGTQLESQTSTQTPIEEKAEDNEQALTIEQAEKEYVVSEESVKDDNEMPANDTSFSSIKTRSKTRKWLFVVIAIVMVLGSGVYLLTTNSANKKHLLSEKESKEVIVTLASIIKNYDDIGTSVSDGLIAVSKNGKWGFINTKGEEVIPCKYDFGANFSENLTAVCIDGKWGYINVKGEEVIPCIYDDVKHFSEGLSTVKTGDKWGYINSKGEDIIPCKYDEAENFSEGLAAVRIDGKHSFINTKGEEVIQCKYDWADSFSEGLANVEIDGKWGFVNTKGEEVIPCKYDGASGFSEGLANVGIGGKGGFINTKGEEVIPCKYDENFGFSEGFAAVRIDGKWGFINTKGELVIPCKFDDYEDDEYNYDGGLSNLYHFSEGITTVKQNGKYGVINAKGEEVIPCIYDNVEVFSEGFAVVRKDGNKGLIDRFGNSTFDYSSISTTGGNNTQTSNSLLTMESIIELHNNMNKEHIVQVLKKNGYSLSKTTEDRENKAKAEYWTKNVLLKEDKDSYDEIIYVPTESKGSCVIIYEGEYYINKLFISVHVYAEEDFKEWEGQLIELGYKQEGYEYDEPVENGWTRRGNRGNLCKLYKDEKGNSVEFMLDGDGIPGYAVHSINGN